jgi:hypothetical protein
MTMTLRLISLLLALLPAGFAAAADYQVELVVFARNGGGSEEQLRQDYRLRYPAALVALQPAQGGAAAPFQLLPSDALRLGRDAAAIDRSGSMRVLFHGAWRQQPQPRDRADSVLIQGGRRVGAHHELEGYVTLALERYLHIDTDLWLSRFGAAGDVQGEGPQLPLPPVGIAPPADDAAAPAAQAIEQLSVLREQRRMRSGELHYLDHPRFGALVLVTPVQAEPEPAAETPPVETPPAVTAPQ